MAGNPSELAGTQTRELRNRPLFCDLAEGQFTANVSQPSEPCRT
jgi:hypothetical protein